MIAHQKIVRDRVALTKSGDLFGKWWQGVDTDISKAVVRETDSSTARTIIEEYEWLGCLAAINWYYYGIFFDGVCGGIVVYGPEYIENLGRWDKYGYTGKIILLNRGACVHWAHPHSASKLIRQSMKLLPNKYEVVTATVDDLAGEIGTIYQACGFDYVGSMRDANPNVNSYKGDRDAWMINGKLYGSRAMRQKFGTTKMEVLKSKFPDIRHVKQNSKGRYFAFRGSKKAVKENRLAIQHLLKTYPKRQPKYTALYVRKDSDYKDRTNWDCWDSNRDALKYKGKEPVVAHPPCRLWGNLSHLACRDLEITEEQKAKEKSLAVHSLKVVRENGGILEHPSKSKLFQEFRIPDLTEQQLDLFGAADEWGGFSIEIDQYDFGHIAHKMTKLYICGLDRDELPELPPKDKSIHICEKGHRRSICGNIKGTVRCTQKQREYTPDALIDWFEKTLNKIGNKKNLDNPLT
jgi:hypothetical protein